MEGNLLLIGSQLEARSGEKLVSCWNDDASGFLTICPATQQPLRHSEHFRIISRCNQRAIFCRKNDKSTFLLKSFWQDFNMLLEKCGYVLLDKSLITHEIDNYREFLSVEKKETNEEKREILCSVEKLVFCKT